jgi:DNA-binding NtrC family response regulator
VIEDQQELGRVIRDILRAEGFEAVPVRDAAAALDTLRERQAAFLVSDLPLSGGDDGDPLAGVTEAFPDLPVIVIRDVRSDDVPFFGPWRREGSRLLLRRPFRLDDLLAAAREIHAGQAG